MGLSLVKAPLAEPVSLDEALAHLRVTQDTEDGLIAGYMLAARAYAEATTRSALMLQTWDYEFDYSFPLVTESNPIFNVPVFYYRYRIELPKPPLQMVQWVRYVDSSGVTQTVDPSLYVVVTNGPVPFIEPAYGQSWPTPRFQPRCGSIRFDCGYGSAPGDVPENIRQAIMLLVAYWYDNRGSAQFGARGRSSDVTTSIMPAEIPPGVDLLLSMDRSVRITS